MFVLVANPDRASGLGADRLATLARTMAGPIVLVTCAAWLELSALIRWNPSKAPVLDLGARGATIPRSRQAVAEPVGVVAALEALGLVDAVIKR